MTESSIHQSYSYQIFKHLKWLYSYLASEIINFSDTILKHFCILPLFRNEREEPLCSDFKVPFFHSAKWNNSFKSLMLNILCASSLDLGEWCSSLHLNYITPTEMAVLGNCLSGIKISGDWSKESLLTELKQQLSAIFFIITPIIINRKHRVELESNTITQFTE